MVDTGEESVDLALSATLMLMLVFVVNAVLMVAAVVR